MCLKPQPMMPIPPEIAAWGQAHLADDDLYRFVGDTLFAHFHDADFADLYHPEGKPALSPVLLALVTVFQQHEKLPDRAAAQAVRTRLDWKYALHLPLADDGFDASVLCEFRQRLLDHDAEARIFEQVLSAMREQGWLRQRGRQRTDSTHVLAAIRALNRVETVGEALRLALNVLAEVAPDWLEVLVQPEWRDRYGPRFTAWHLPKGEGDRIALAEQIGRDGREVLCAVSAASAPADLRALPAIETLRRIWVQQFYQEGAVLRWRTASELPPASVAINSPHDPQARYSSKRSTIWVGYKVHLSEVCDDDAPHLITNVEVTPAPVADTTMTALIHAHLADAERLPTTHLVDAGYVDAEHLVASRDDYGVDLYGPVPVDPSWQARNKTGYETAAFTYDWEAEVATCPQGQHSRRWRHERDGNGNPVVHIEFAGAVCRTCAVHEQCTTAASRGRQLNIREHDAFEALQRARQRQTTPSFKEQYATRAGIEGTLSRAVRSFGLRRSRYVGEAKTRLQALCVATAMNIARISSFLADSPPPKRQPVPFIQFMKAATA